MQKERRFNFLLFACVLLWTMMMGSKNVYTAELVEICGIFNVDKADASLAMTYYFVVYSFAQIALFFFMENLNPKWFLSVSIFLSGGVTIVIAFATKMYQLWWILALNGLLQAGVWGMCIAVLKKFLPPRRMPFANTIMNVGTSVAAVISYSSSAISVALGSWNMAFIILGALLSISAIIFFFAVHLCEKAKSENNEAGIKEEIYDDNPPIALHNGLHKALFFIITFVFSFIIHFPFYGVLNWLPNFLTENFQMENSAAILISVFAPLATVISPIIAIRHCEKAKSCFTVCLLYLIISSVLCLILTLIYNLNVVLSLSIVVLLVVAIQASVTIVFSVLPIKMGKYINSGAHASLMNSAGGFAAGFAPTIIGALLTSVGWQISYAVTFGILIATTLSVLLIVALVKKR